MPVLFFTQVLALALGLDPAACRFEQNPGGAVEMLREKGLVPEPATK